MWLILDGLSEMVGGDDLCIRQVCNRPRHFQHPMHLVSTEVELLDGGFQQFPRRIVYRTLGLNLH